MSEKTVKISVRTDSVQNDIRTGASPEYKPEPSLLEAIFTVTFIRSRWMGWLQYIKS
jgi:hypothetical protein